MKAAIDQLVKHCKEWKWTAAAAAAADLPEALIQRIHVIQYDPDPAHKRGMITLRIILMSGGYIETLQLPPTDPSMVLLIRAAKITLEGLAAKAAAPKTEILYPVLPDGGGGIPVEVNDAKTE